MEKVKQEVFSNFNYAIIESIDKRCVDVKCTYNYKGKTLTHYFSYAKSGNKQNSYYIGRAKADMDKLIKDKKAESVAKKDLKGSEATFFKRHKKPILIATTAVLVAGIATAATLITLKYVNNRNPESVTEAEINEHLNFPTGELTTMYDQKVIAKILTDSIAEIQNIAPEGLEPDYAYNLRKSGNINKINDFTIKRMSSYQAKIPDPFDYMNGDNSQSAPAAEDLRTKSNSELLGGSILPDSGKGFNDTTKFCTNASFKNKKVNSVYEKVELKQNPSFSHSHIINTYDEEVENLTTKTVYESNNYITHKKDKDEKETIFENGTTTYDGTPIQNLNTVLHYGVEGYEDCEAALEIENANQTVFYGDLNQLLMIEGKFTPTFYQKNENEVYAIYFTPYNIPRRIPSVYYPPIYDDYGDIIDEGGVEGYSSPISIWHFVKDKSYALRDNEGWLLKSYALDRSTYTKYNDRYEKLEHPITVDIEKGFVEFSYGEKKSAEKDVEKMEVPNLKSNEVEAPALPVDEMRLFSKYKEGDSSYTPFGNRALFDITIPNRISSKNDYYVAVSKEPIHIPSLEELESSVKNPDPKNVLLQMDVTSAYFANKRQKKLNPAIEVVSGPGTRSLQEFKINSDDKYFKAEKGPFCGGAYVALKSETVEGEEVYPALGHDFNITIVYKSKQLSFVDPEEETTLPENSILIPSEITFTLAK